MLAALQARKSLVLRVSDYLHRRSGAVAQFRVIALLTDGTRLHINEVWVDDKLVKYAYYHLSPTDDIIQGWDNAPHHPEISTFPHHCHCNGAVEASDVRSLEDVLDTLESKTNQR
jgi:hypothetical protein